MRGKRRTKILGQWVREEENQSLSHWRAISVTEYILRVNITSIMPTDACHPIRPRVFDTPVALDFYAYLNACILYIHKIFIYLDIFQETFVTKIKFNSAYLLHFSITIIKSYYYFQVIYSYCIKVFRYLLKNNFFFLYNNYRRIICSQILIHLVLKWKLYSKKEILNTYFNIPT